MVRLILAAAAMLAALPAAGQGKPEVLRAYGVRATASIRLTAIAGATQLRVIGWSHDSLELRGTLPAASRIDGGVATGGGGAKLYVESPARDAQAPVILELRVPQRSRIWVKLGSGDVDVRDLRGAVDANIVNGSIRVAGTLTEVNAEAMDGSITVTASAEWLRAKTAGGAIVLTGAAADAGLTSVGGAVTVGGGPYTRLRIETVTGDVTVAGALERAGQLTIDSHAGAVEVALPPKTGAEIDVITVQGTVQNRLDGARPQPGMGGRGLELGTAVAGGGRSIMIRTFKGPVTLRPDAAAGAPGRP